MTIFWRLILAHLLADFTFQFNFVAKWKRTRWYGLLLHCFIHYLCFIFLTFPFLNLEWAYGLTGWKICLIITLIHYLIDAFKSFCLNGKYLRDGLHFFLFDQMLHYYVIFLFAGFLEVPFGMQALSTRWIIMLSIFAFIAQPLAVHIYYMDKELDRDTLFPSLSQEYFMIVERLVLVLFFFMPGIWWQPCAFLWIMQMIMIKARKMIDITKLNLAFSIVITIAFGVLGRILFYGSF